MLLLLLLVVLVVLLLLLLLLLVIAVDVVSCAVDVVSCDVLLVDVVSSAVGASVVVVVPSSVYSEPLWYRIIHISQSSHAK